MTRPWFAVCLLLGACAIPTPPQGSGDTIREIAVSAARSAGLTPTEVTVEELRVTRADDDRDLEGYLAWMEVEECLDGKAVVRLSRSGYVQDIFGRFGCAV